ncbi:hypothetical protein M407DRAFT_19887 [Tulasnella calospora MUT 4182]|uniref:F-box domain-containing protein n=1 Tax=Tulasnella calospora MUT 4182 TaxID=1051891 RepID=A0A0C3QGY9_9AGAM|nr:hypothetical protein M407DRAFT_19887 [Tulasnella calospora MUT 4182]
MAETNLKDTPDDKSNCAHHASLDLPHILTTIFSNCNPSTTAALARVCRTWNDLAIDQLWSSLPSLLPLLRILLPLVVVGGALDFDRKARPPNWKRFWELASKVRRLEHVDTLEGHTTESPTQLSGRISPNVIPYLFLQQSWTGRLFLLPKLARLEWSVNWGYSLFQLCHFLSPTLRDLIIPIGNRVPIDQVIQNLEYLAALPPTNVRALSISANYPGPNPGVRVAAAVASFIKSQPTLLVLELPSIWTRGEIVDSLVQHSNLIYLDLLLCCDTLAKLRSLLELLARQCPRICYFTYNLPSSFPQLTPHYAIEPLLSCRRLRQIQIFHKHGLSVGSDEIKKMAQAWREMEVLRLCASAADPMPLGTPLALLLEFAEDFSPCLRQLALNFVFDVELPTADVIWASFPRLDVLGVGTSKPESTAQAIVAAEFLTAVCSEQTELAYISADGWRPDAFDTVSRIGGPLFVRQAGVRDRPSSHPIPRKATMSKTNLGVTSDVKSNRAHHPLLDFPDILTIIFTDCSPATNAALARVCRTWNDVAVDRLWSSLPSLLPLLRILLPLIIVDDVLAWREMEVLRLCASAPATAQMGTPLALLLHFAEQFSPRLRQLALNFVFDGGLPTADVVWTSFPRLDVLGVGTSKPESTAQAIVAAEFLTAVCSEQTELAYISADGWRPDAFDTVSWKNAPEVNHWVEVAAMMDFGRRVRKAALTKAPKAGEADSS